jgi:dTDP-4-dehydrorhamnose 3,5-epimerase
MIKGIKIFKSDIFKDKRGSIWTSWELNKSSKISFRHDKFAMSKKNTLRGLHYDSKTWKFISCVYGKVFFVVVNCEPKSKDYLKYSTMILDSKNNEQVLVPPNFANGHLCLSENCLFHYKLSYKGKYSDVGDQKNIKWYDKRLNIRWPIKKNLITSKRDK